jgi:hypothetical protein
MTMTNAAINNGRMTERDYARERDHIRAVYGDLKGQPVAQRDKALARLFLRSHWTQTEIGAAETKPRSQTWVSQHLLFGDFLQYVDGRLATWPKSKLRPPVAFHNALAVLSEGGFRKYWRLTGDGDDETKDARFATVFDWLGRGVSPPPSQAPRSGVALAFSADPDILNLLTPNGKALGECVKADVTALAKGFARIAAKLKPGETVRDAMTDAEARDLLRAR